MKIGSWKGMVGLGTQTLGMSTDFEQEEGRDFPGGPMVKSLPANAGHVGSVSGLGRCHMPRGH